MTYDAAGNQTGDPESNATYTYDQGGRLSMASIGGVLKSTRIYNGLGQRALGKQGDSSLVSHLHQ